MGPGSLFGYVDPTPFSQTPFSQLARPVNFSDSCHRGDRLPFGEFSDRFVQLAFRHDAHLDLPAHFPYTAHVRHDLLVGPVYVDRHAYECPGRQPRQPEGFDPVSLGIAEVEADGARVGYERSILYPFSMALRLKLRTSSSDSTLSEICRIRWESSVSRRPFTIAIS